MAPASHREVFTKVTSMPHWTSRIWPEWKRGISLGVGESSRSPAPRAPCWPNPQAYISPFWDTATEWSQPPASMTIFLSLKKFISVGSRWSLSVSIPNFPSLKDPQLCIRRRVRVSKKWWGRNNLICVIWTYQRTDPDSVSAIEWVAPDAILFTLIPFSKSFLTGLYWGVSIWKIQVRQELA